jgi:hypothetical protein
MIEFYKYIAPYILPAVFFVGYSVGQFFLLNDLYKNMKKGRLEAWLKRMGMDR